MTDREIAKNALDKIISKSRVHLYKPIQIAEILYRHRIGNGDINLLNLNDYRNQSKKWRDEISNEFPSLEETPEILKGRMYDKIDDEFWRI